MPPIAMLPVICWPQRDLKRVPERFSVWSGPVPSMAMTGTARKVTSDQPMSRMRPTIWPSVPWLSSALSAVPTIAENAAQPAIGPMLARATARPSATVASSPRKSLSAAAARPTEKKMLTKARIRIPTAMSGIAAAS